MIGWAYIRPTESLFADPAASPLPHPLPFESQAACYLPWLKISVLLRYALTARWGWEAWREVREAIPWLVQERDRIRRAGWFN